MLVWRGGGECLGNTEENRTDSRYSGVIRSVEWQFFANVSGQLIGPIFKGQEVQEEKEEILKV
jgi:hypothetical protein